jgi:type I site-specific restriction endonuclease
MKRLSCWIFLSCLWLTSFSQAQPKASVKDQILPLLREQMLAANAHDTDRFLATYLHTAELIFIANGQIFRGWDNVHDEAQMVEKWQERCCLQPAIGARNHQP